MLLYILDVGVTIKDNFWYDEHTLNSEVICSPRCVHYKVCTHLFSIFVHNLYCVKCQVRNSKVNLRVIFYQFYGKSCAKWQLMLSRISKIEKQNFFPLSQKCWKIYFTIEQITQIIYMKSTKKNRARIIKSIMSTTKIHVFHYDGTTSTANYYVILRSIIWCKNAHWYVGITSTFRFMSTTNIHVL